MTAEDFLAIWLALTLAVSYLLLVGLWCLLIPRFIRWVMRQDLEATPSPDRNKCQS